MSTSNRATRGDFALTLLRWGLLATASAMVGVLGHAAWRWLTFLVQAP